MAKVIMSEFTEIDDNLLYMLKKGETVRQVVGTKHYYVTNIGRVFSGKKTIIYEMIDGKKLYCIIWKELKQRICNGYLSVNIDGKREYVHKLVFEAYNDRVNTRVLKIVHKDKNKLNNHVSNLQLAWRNKYNIDEHEQYLYQQRMLGNIDKMLKNY